MNTSLPITSAQNPKVKQLQRLREKRERSQEQKFLIEGYREILRASSAKQPIETLFLCEELFLGSHEPELIQKVRLQGAHIYTLPKELFCRCSYRDRPDGLIAIAPIRRQSFASFKEAIYKRAAGQPLFLVIAESIEKPGNLGSMFRSADAAYVHGILVCDRQTDVFNPNVVRSSIGTLFTVPFIECSLEEALQFLQQEGVALVAATPHAQQLFTRIDLQDSVAIAMGSEQLGLSEELMQKAALHAKIPMLGEADSLNVAAATTLLLYEVVRQRS